MSWDKCVQKEMRVQEGRKQKGICGKEGTDPVVRTVKGRSGGLEVWGSGGLGVWRSNILKPLKFSGASN